MTEDFKSSPRLRDSDFAFSKTRRIYGFPGGKAQDALVTAIREKEAVRRLLKDRLYDFNLQEKWYKYRDICYERAARDWCERFGMETEE